MGLEWEQDKESLVKKECYFLIWDQLPVIWNFMIDPIFYYAFQQKNYKRHSYFIQKLNFNLSVSNLGLFYSMKIRTSFKFISVAVIFSASSNLFVKRALSQS